MGSKSRYRVQIKEAVQAEDLPALPVELQESFNDLCESVFAEDPYGCFGLLNHALKGRLSGYRTLETDWAGIAYRLIYRIYEKPAPRRVVIFSFDKHDPAYDKAKVRAGRKR